jgi:hypothetical protein
MSSLYRVAFTCLSDTEITKALKIMAPCTPHVEYIEEKLKHIDKDKILEN